MATVPFSVLFFQVTVDLHHFPEFKDDAAFASGMLIEQSVFTLPGMVREQNLLIFLGADSELKFYYNNILCRHSQPQVVSG